MKVSGDPKRQSTGYRRQWQLLLRSCAHQHGKVSNLRPGPKHAYEVVPQVTRSTPLKGIKVQAVLRLDHADGKTVSLARIIRDCEVATNRGEVRQPEKLLVRPMKRAIFAPLTFLL
jgi:hypothetical protein